MPAHGGKTGLQHINFEVEPDQDELAICRIGGMSYVSRKCFKQFGHELISGLIEEVRKSLERSGSRRPKGFRVYKDGRVFWVP